MVHNIWDIDRVQLNTNRLIYTLGEVEMFFNSFDIWTKNIIFIMETPLLLPESQLEEWLLMNGATI